jgi:hypothetical protein
MMESGSGMVCGQSYRFVLPLSLRYPQNFPIIRVAPYIPALVDRKKSEQQHPEVPELTCELVCTKNLKIWHSQLPRLIYAKSAPWIKKKNSLKRVELVFRDHLNVAWGCDWLSIGSVGREVAFCRHVGCSNRMRCVESSWLWEIHANSMVRVIAAKLAFPIFWTCFWNNNIQQQPIDQLYQEWLRCYW